MKRNLSLGACFLLAVLFLSSGSLMAQQPQVVVGANNPAIDVPAVQAAVDRGGTVMLRGTFDFGADAGNHIIVPGRPFPDQDAKGKSTIFIYRSDVTIVGETGSRGELLTVVKNGMPPFWIGWDGQVFRERPAEGEENVDFGVETFPQDAAGTVWYRDDAVATYDCCQTRYARAFQHVSATIKNIYFDSPRHYGVKAAAGHDIAVIGNVFSKVRFGGLVHVNGLYGPGTSSGATHVAVASMGVSLFYAPFITPAVSGKIRIEENVADDVGTEAIATHAGETYGFGALLTGGGVDIQGNTIRNVGREVGGSYSDVILAGGIMVADNYASSPVIAENSIDNTIAYGIWDAAFLGPAPTARIERNSVTDCGFTGIAVEAWAGPRAGGWIYFNSLAQDDRQFPGSSLIGVSGMNGSTIDSNTLAGDVPLVGVVLQAASNCSVIGNRDKRKPISGGPSTYLLDALSSGNLVKAATGSAVDNGTNNKILIAKQ